MKLRFLRRMRETAYMQGYQSGMSKGFADGYKAGAKGSPVGRLLRTTGAIRPDQDARVVPEDPFLASDWQQITDGR